MFDFHYISEKNRPLDQEEKCRALGYDGLAILKTPEALKYAISIAFIMHGVYIGLQYNPEFGHAVWDDGTIPRSDTPFHGTPPFGDPDKPYGRIIWSSKLALGKPGQRRPAICGNHKNYRMQSMGSLMPGTLQITSKTILSVSRMFSYLECAVLCGITYECRAAEFNSDLLTCTVIGEYTSTGSIANSQVWTYIRQTF
ncbi:hypothetical protein ElyMa_005929600 [Elysia marginata]|uniref:C-type lectin domain-containing protein n=1 Tax=Elysia marginata TaxID=1093978 RepID=A0AAV4G8I9_9GAST|nr:hypothetical protein ElyMa_005929600 [Elysia marginata]